MFKRIDADNDNGVTQSEFDDFLQQMTPPPPAAKKKEGKKSKPEAEDWRSEALIAFYAKHGALNWLAFPCSVPPLQPPLNNIYGAQTRKKRLATSRRSSSAHRPKAALGTRTFARR